MSDETESKQEAAGEPVSAESTKVEWFRRSGESIPGHAKLTDVNPKLGTARADYECLCGKCSGNGYIREYAVVENGVCFDCDGKGRYHVECRAFTEARLTLLDSREEVKRATAAEKLKAAEEAGAKGYAQTQPAFLEKLRTLGIAEEIRFRTKAGISAEEEINCGDENVGPCYAYWRKAVKRGLDGREHARALKLVAVVEERRAKDANRGHVGTPGEKFTTTLRGVKVIKLGSVYSKFGVSYIHLMDDPDGNRLVYKGKSSAPGEGKVAEVEFKVKEHGERDGVKQTVIERLKIIRWIEESEAVAKETPAADPAVESALWAKPFEGDRAVFSGVIAGVHENPERALLRTYELREIHVISIRGVEFVDVGSISMKGAVYFAGEPVSTPASFAVGDAVRVSGMVSGVTEKRIILNQHEITRAEAVSAAPDCGEYKAVSEGLVDGQVNDVDDGQVNRIGGMK